MRILAISSQVAFGPVGNSAAVPALQASGHEVLAVPTIVLSSHPGHGRPAAIRCPARDIAAILDTLEQMAVLRNCGAVMTGYFASNDQVHVAARMIRTLSKNACKPFVLVDPVIGDGDALYVPETVARAIRDDLMPLADCTAPNRFELEWLTGWRAASIKEAEAAARTLPCGEVLATSIPGGRGKLATLVVHAGGCEHVLTPERKSAPHGTGDFLSGLYLARRALGSAPALALGAAMATLERAMELSAGLDVLDIAGALKP